MNTSLRLFIFATEVLTVLVIVYFEPTRCVRGRLWGEAFFDGKPTSFWREELKRPEVKRALAQLWFGGSGPIDIGQRSLSRCVSN